jgi:hypothetical protein
MSTFKLTGPIARAEIARRANNKRTGTYEPAASPEVMRLTGAQLQAASKRSPERKKGTPTPVKSAAKVSQRSAADVAATALRKQAWTMRQAGEGTYRECLAAIGGTPAK